MPTILRKGGFKVIIYYNDHLPYHVHVVKAGGEAKITLGGENECPEWLSVSGMNDKDAIKALEIVQVHKLELLEKWYEYHGQQDFERERAKGKTCEGKDSRSR